MLVFLLALLFPLLANACLCPSCGCGGGGGSYGGGSYYGGGGGGYSGGYGYGQPYNVFYNQPMGPAGRGVEVRAPFYGQQTQQQYLPQLQAPPQFPQQASQHQRPGYVQSPTLVGSQPQYQPPAPRLNTYPQPVQQPSLGYQPARAVEPLRGRSIVSATSAPYTGTTRISAAKKVGKNSDYEYYYVYYDENGKKTGTGTAKPRIHDGAIQSRSTSAPQNNIDEYDFDDAKDVNGEIPVASTLAPVSSPVTIALPSTAAAIPISIFVEPHGEVHSVEEVTTATEAETSSAASTKESAPVEDGDPIYEDIDAAKGKTTTEPAKIVSVETVTFETAAPTVTETTESTTLSVSSTKNTTESIPGKEEPKMYEYEEYEIEEIQLVNENGVTETVTRIITTTKAPPKTKV